MITGEYYIKSRSSAIPDPSLDDIRYFHDKFQKAGLVGQGAELKSAEALVQLLQAYLTVKKAEFNVN
jgi:hypothetical protein